MNMIIIIIIVSCNGDHCHGYEHDEYGEYDDDICISCCGVELWWGCLIIITIMAEMTLIIHITL